jgi:hypothetical protein
MEYPQIQIVNGRFMIPRVYPGQHGMQMSVKYYRHHKGWTTSQNFRDQVEILCVPESSVADLMNSHDRRLQFIAYDIKFDPITRFRMLAFRLLQAE